MAAYEERHTMEKTSALPAENWSPHEEQEHGK